MAITSLRALIVSPNRHHIAGDGFDDVTNTGIAWRWGNLNGSKLLPTNSYRGTYPFAIINNGTMVLTGTAPATSYQRSLILSPANILTELPTLNGDALTGMATTVSHLACYASDMTTVFLGETSRNNAGGLTSNVSKVALTFDGTGELISSALTEFAMKPAIFPSNPCTAITDTLIGGCDSTGTKCVGFVSTNGTNSPLAYYFDGTNFNEVLAPNPATDYGWNLRLMSSDGSTAAGSFVNAANPSGDWFSWTPTGGAIPIGGVVGYAGISPVAISAGGELIIGNTYLIGDPSKPLTVVYDTVAGVIHSIALAGYDVVTLTAVAPNGVCCGYATDFAFSVAVPVTWDLINGVVVVGTTPPDWTFPLFYNLSN